MISLSAAANDMDLDSIKPKMGDSRVLASTEELACIVQVPDAPALEGVTQAWG